MKGFKIFNILTRSSGSPIMSDKISPTTWAGKAIRANFPPFKSDKLILKLKLKNIVKRRIIITRLTFIPKLRKVSVRKMTLIRYYRKNKASLSKVWLYFKKVEVIFSQISLIDNTVLRNQYLTEFSSWMFAPDWESFLITASLSSRVSGCLGEGKRALPPPDT